MTERYQPTQPREKFSRRSFLKKTATAAAVTAGGLALAGGVLETIEHFSDGICSMETSPKNLPKYISSNEDIDGSRKFPQEPKKFLWGSATAPFQVEGNSRERKTDWDVFEAKKNIIPSGEQGPNWQIPGNAEKDIKDMKKLGLNAQRYGFEWGSIEPEQGKINQDALKRGRGIVDFLLKNGMTPMMTAQHFALPQWVAKEGGWENEKIIGWFRHYAEILAENFPDVPYWVTINEPNVLATVGYGAGYWPPEKKGVGGLLSVFRSVYPNMIEAHYLAGNELTRQGAKKETVQVGTANAINWLKPERKGSELDELPIETFGNLFNYKFLKSAISNSDFAGINFYTGYWMKFKAVLGGRNQDKFPMAMDEIPFGKVVRHEDELLSDVGWPIVPDFFLEALQCVYSRFKKPIIITENGIADREDKLRSFYILTHLIALHEAIKRGVDVKGYFHWATVDNLEWREGFGPRFGLIARDPKTGERAIRQSAELYGEIATSNEIDVNRLMEKYLTPESGQRELTDKFLKSLK